jgi:hypothetical protein
MGRDAISPLWIEEWSGVWVSGDDETVPCLSVCGVNLPVTARIEAFFPPLPEPPMYTAAERPSRRTRTPLHGGATRPAGRLPRLPRPAPSHRPPIARLSPLTLPPLAPPPPRRRDQRRFHTCLPRRGPLDHGRVPHVTLRGSSLLWIAAKGRRPGLGAPSRRLSERARQVFDEIGEAGVPPPKS